MSRRKTRGPLSDPQTGNRSTGSSSGSGKTYRDPSADPSLVLDPNATYWTDWYNNQRGGRPMDNSMWANFFSNMAINESNGRSMDELFAALSAGGMSQNAKDAYLQWILEQWMTWQKTTEQREYDKSVLEEQRIYDNPTNQLARLMGSGISRDAAIQMMSGGSSGSGTGGSALIGSGAGTGLSSTVDPNEVLNAELNKANTVINAFSTIASFAAMGVNMRQASVQTRAQELQNSLTENQIKGINSAGEVVGAVNNLVTNGTLSQADLDGFRNAQDLLSYVLDHKDTNGFKHLFENGTYDFVSSTSYGRNALSGLWKDLISTRMDGTTADQAYNETANRLILQGLNQQQFAEQITGQILTNQHLWNQTQQDVLDLLDGSIQLEIDGEILSQEKLNTLLKRFVTHQAGVEDSIFTGVYETPDEEGKTGADYITQSQLNDLYKYCVISSSEKSAMTWDWINNYKRSFFESGRSILLGLLLKNAYSEGTLKTFFQATDGGIGGSFETNAQYQPNILGQGLILTNQTPLLQGINLIRNNPQDFIPWENDNEVNDKGGKARRAAKSAKTVQKLIKYMPK